MSADWGQLLDLTLTHNTNSKKTPDIHQRSQDGSAGESPRGTGSGPGAAYDPQGGDLKALPVRAVIFKPGPPQELQGTNWSWKNSATPPLSQFNQNFHCSTWGFYVRVSLKEGLCG